MNRDSTVLNREKV